MKRFWGTCVAALLMAGMPWGLAIARGETPTGITRAYSDSDTVTYASTASDGVEIRAGENLWCEVPDSFKDRLLQYAVVKYRKDPRCGPENAPRDPHPAWIGLRAKPRGSTGEIVWKDQFGPNKFVPAVPGDRTKQSTFLGFADLLDGKAVEGVRVCNDAAAGMASAAMRLHRIDLVFLHRGPRVAPVSVRRFTRSEGLNTLARRFRLDTKNGLELPPGRSFEFELPEQPDFPWVAYLVLKHRKDPALVSATSTAAEGWDPNPAYILIEIRNAATGLWARWADRYGAAKYSEPRTADNPEDETLHNGLRTFGRIRADRIRITNVGIGDPRLSVARIHELQVVFYPDCASARSFEQIFTLETAFNDPAKNLLIPLLGGGPRLQGKFPGAVPLGPGSRARAAAIAALPASHTFPVTLDPPGPCRLDGLGRLVIPLPGRGRLVMAEVAIGDLDVTTMEPNKDGFFGRPGRAELTAWLRNRSVPGRSFPALIRNNIGMAGLVTFGAPIAAGPLRAGDELVLSVNFDVAFLMGYRVTCADEE